MGRSAQKADALQDEYLTDKCIEKRQGPETDVRPDCLGAAMEAMFHDKYNVTVTYSEQVRQEQTDGYEFVSSKLVEISTENFIIFSIIASA
jgi:hypothetical protein